MVSVAEITHVDHSAPGRGARALSFLRRHRVFAAAFAIGWITLTDVGTMLVDAWTTRAFAGILAEGLAGASPEEVLAVPEDIYQRMGLAQAISPLRIRGGIAILGRLKRQVREQLA